MSGFLKLFYILIVPIFVSEGECNLSPCQLKWVPFISGQEFPENAVSLDADQFVAMVTISLQWGNLISLKENFAGTAMNSTKRGTFVNLGSLLIVSSYSILTNPNDCSLSWVDAPNGLIPQPQYAVSIGAGKYVGIRKSKGKVTAGTLIQSDVSLFYAINFETGQPGTFLACEVLISTENLKLTIGDVDTSRPVGLQKADVMGFDYIDNNSGATLEHTLSHQTTVIVRRELTESNSFAQSTQTTIDFSLKVPGILTLDINFQSRHDSSKGELSNIVNENEETVKTLRTIIVPPYTKLEACSVLFTAQDSAIPYTGVGTYHIPGRDSNYVQNILKGQNYDYTKIIKKNETHVFVHIEGTVSVDIPMKSKIIVHLANDKEGCSEIQRTINDLKRATVFEKRPLRDEKVIRIKDKLNHLLNE